MPGAGCLAHAEKRLSDTLILDPRCNDKEPRARGKKSTEIVDKFAEKFSGRGNLPCFTWAGTVCLFFRRIAKSLILQDKLFNILQIPEKSGDFVTGV
jgi:hypothetical protein